MSTNSAAGGDKQPSSGEQPYSSGGDKAPSAGGEEQPSAGGEEQPSASGEEQPSPAGEEQPSPAGDTQSSSGGGWSAGFQRFVQNVQTSVEKKQESMRVASEAKEIGKVWDPEKKKWYFYFLDQELIEVEKLMSKQESLSQQGSNVADDEKEVADREYYDLLEVSPAADESTIRKAYFKKARQCHPDKNPDDPEAHERFQQLGHAYQILSDPTKRANYDKNGKGDDSAAESMDEIDPSVFFNVMFGSTLIEPYVGELWIATMSDSLMKGEGNEIMEGLDSGKNPEELTEEERAERDRLLNERMEAMQEQNKLKQRLRQIKCAINLRKRVEDYKQGQEEDFVQHARYEAIQIAQGSYGSVYLTTIGFALKIAAEEFLGFHNSQWWGLGGHVARTRKSASAMGSNFKLIGAGIKAVGAGSKAMKEAEKLQVQAGEGKEIDEQAAVEMAGAIDESLPVFLELAWAINKRDIQQTLQVVCRKVFEDASVPKEDRLVRAKAVRALGDQFQLVGKAFPKNYSNSTDPNNADDIKARFAVATMATMAKAQGQEISEQDQQDMLKQAMQMSTEAKKKPEEKQEDDTGKTGSQVDANENSETTTGSKVDASMNPETTTGSKLDSKDGLD